MNKEFHNILNVAKYYFFFIKYTPEGLAVAGLRKPDDCLRSMVGMQEINEKLFNFHENDL